MFGHTDNQQSDDQVAAQPMHDPMAQNDQVMHDGSLEEPSTVAEHDQHGYADNMGEIPSSPIPEPAPSNDNPFALPSVPAPEPSTPGTLSAPAAPASPMGGNDTTLLDLKQKALQQLSPLVNHLDQSPEEKFKTTMMMIQASDDQSLLPAAYEAAQAITDEKAKAQALLDVVNEINYFTQSR